LSGFIWQGGFQTRNVISKSCERCFTLFLLQILITLMNVLVAA
jgi:hypothetical protein